MKLEDYRTSEESEQIQTIETTIKELEKKRKIYSSAVENLRTSLYAAGMGESQANDKILKSYDYEKRACNRIDSCQYLLVLMGKRNGGIRRIK